MNAAWRIRTILAHPAAEWGRIEKEPADAAHLLIGYVALLALIPAVFGFVGSCIVGAVVPGAGLVRAPLFNGFFGAVFGYVMTCASVLVLALAIDLLAPMFAARRDFDSAFKLAAYSSTPVWLTGIFLSAPGLRFLELIGFYGAYVLWLGLPRLMKSPKDRSLVYAAVIVICAAALSFLSAAAQQAVFGAAPF